MSIETTDAVEAKKELEESVKRLLTGVRDPEAMRKAAERMDQMRERLKERIGTVEVAADLIRDARNQ